jgi:acyl-CoA thioesterase-1
LALATLATIGFGALEARAGAAIVCPATTPTAFAENGAETPLAEPAQNDRRLRILAIGSSSTLGVGATSPSAAYPAQLASDLASQWGIDAAVVNAGIGGELSAATLQRLVAALAANPPDLIVWQVGTNDAIAGVDPQAFRASLTAGIAAARVRDTPIVLVDPQFYFGIKDLARYEQFTAIVGEVGEAEHVAVFSRFAMMRAWAAKSAATLRAALAPDGFHMDDEGYACFARALAGDLAREGDLGEARAEKL